jgi:flagellar basal-body rod protein FlgB
MDTRLFPAIEDRMDWTAKRHQILNANVTNIDTPGYHTKDVSFSDQLQFLQLRASNGKHITSPLGDSRMELYEVQIEPDIKDNSVSLDREMTELSKNGLMYLTMIQFVSQKLKTLRSAINEGNRG